MEDKVFELLTQLYSEMNARFDKVDTRLDKSENELLKTNMKIEHDILPKLDVLFDGYKQNSEQLSRIESEVIKHEEVILRRIK